MQTRRRFQQDTVNLTESQDERSPLIQQQHQSHHQVQLSPGAGLSAAPLLASGNNTNSEYKIQIGEGRPQDSVTGDLDVDDKYKKASRQWNLRSLSSRIQATSEQALRTFLQEPLSAAAAVVAGNHSYEDENSKHNSGVREQYLLQEEEFESEALFSKNNILVMAARDRTAEFSNAIRSLQSRNITRAVNIRDPRKARQVQSYSEFMAVAKYIGKNIASTYAKLEKLTLLAKKRGIFDDRPQEIQELTYIIKGDLNALNQQIARLQDISKDQRRTNNGKHLVSHSSNMVLALQSKLASMSTDFKQILEVRTENLKQQKNRRDQFGQGPLAVVNSVAPTTAKQGSLLLSEGNRAISIDMSANDNTPLLEPPVHQQTQQQIALYDDSDSYIQQRAETMQNIESTIVELGGIFQQLAHMVREQEEIVERIDTNIQDTGMNVEAAHTELLKYFRTVSKNRWLMIKIFGVLIFFFILFVFLT